MAISDKPGGSTKTVVRRTSDGTTRVLNYPGLRYYNEKVVRSVNGVKPDQNGNVNTKGGAGSAQTKPSYWDDPLIHRIEIKPEDWKTFDNSNPDTGIFFRTMITMDRTEFIPVSAMVNDADKQIPEIAEAGGFYSDTVAEFYRVVVYLADFAVNPSDGFGVEQIFCNSGDLPPLEQGYLSLDEDGGPTPLLLSRVGEDMTSEYISPYMVYYLDADSYKKWPAGNAKLIVKSHESDLCASFKDRTLIYLFVGVSSRGWYYDDESRLVEVKHDDCQEHFPDKPIYLVVRESTESTADSLYIPRDPNGPKGSPEDNGIGVEEEPEVTADVDGIAEAALKLATPRKIALTGEALGSGQFDGSKDIDIYTTVERITNSELEEALK